MRFIPRVELFFLHIQSLGEVHIHTCRSMRLDSTAATLKPLRTRRCPLGVARVFSLSAERDSSTLRETAYTPPAW